MAVRTDFVAGEVLAAQDLDDTFAAKIDYATPVNTQTGTTYTFVLADGLRLTTANNAAASTFTVPPQSSVVWVANSIIRLVNLGAGAVTIDGGSGVTVTNTAATVAQFQSVDCIRTGSDAWTVVVAGGGDESGLVHINTNTFTTQSSVSLNNVFTSAHVNYKIVVNVFGTGDNNVNMRLRATGSDDSGSNYRFTEVDGTSNTTVTSFRPFAVGATFISGGHMEVFSPQLAVRTTLTAFVAGGNGGVAGYLISGNNNLTTAFDGFSLIAAAGTITGTVRTYGYQNS